MGVRSCNRTGCENIMCDAYIPEIGYVCQSCQYEFIDKMHNMEIYNSSKSTYLSELKEFMNTYPNTSENVNINDFFDDYK